MVNYYIYAKDFSGSTDGSKHYHSNGLKSLEQFKSDVEKVKNELLIAGEPATESKIIYLHWGDKCYEVDEDTTIKTYKELQSGHMGTNPATIIQWLKKNDDVCGENNKIKLLYIITDGMIDHYVSETCFVMNENMHYETVVFHAFNEAKYGVNMSVAAAFFKSRCMVYCNYELFDDIDISEEFDYDKININNFTAEKDQLKSYIKLKFIKKVKQDSRALQEIGKLKKLRDKLFNELSSSSQKEEVNLETKDKNEFLRNFVCTEWYKNLTVPVYEIKVDVEKSISTLINYIVSDKKSYSFDALRFETNYKNPIEEEPIVDVNFTAEQEIEFPDIILDDDKGIPVIILTECNLLDKIIFHKTKYSNEVSPASFNKFKTAMECPLFLMNDQDISESIGYFYTLNVYKQLLEGAKKTEPRTRRPFHGGLVLTDSNDFDKYNDYIVSATYFNFKKINYNIGLFYFVLWKNCENKEWMDENVIGQFKKYTMRRINETVCNIGLSSLPLDPKENTYLLTALWYCVELSSCIFKDDPQTFMHERLRMFYGVAYCMIEILKYFDYDLDLESIEKRRDLISHVMILKKISRQTDKEYYLLEKIFKTEHGFLVSEIKNPFNLYKLNYLKLNHKEMLRDDVVEEKVNLNDYVHMMHIVGNMNESKAGNGVYEICDKTFRPYFTIDKNTSFYTELVKNTRKIVINYDDRDKIKITYNVIDSLEFDKILSIYNLFINCVKDLEKYPTFDEFIEYILKRKKFKDNLVTIFPPNIYFDVQNIFSVYQNVVTNVEVNKFINVSKSYVSRAQRVKAEEVVTFSDDNEIDAFISSQEIKVNLKK